MARSSEQSSPALAADRGVSSEAPRHWLRQDAADAGRGQPGDLTTDEREELRRLRREVKTLQQEREIPRKAAASCAQETVCAASGPATRSGRTIRSRCCAGSWRWPARPTTPGRAAGSRPAPGPTRPWRRTSPPRMRAAAGRLARRGCMRRCGRTVSAVPASAWPARCTRPGASAVTGGDAPARPSRRQRTSPRRTWWRATSRRRGRTAAGSATARSCRRVRAGGPSPCCATRTRGASSAGRWPTTGARRWPSTRAPWPWAPAARRRGWSTTPIAAARTPPPRSGRAAPRTTSPAR